MGAENIKVEAVWQLIPAEGYLTLRLIGPCETNDLGSFEEEIQKLLSDPFPHVIVNCENIAFLGNDWQRVLLRIQQDLKKRNRFVRFLNVKNPLRVFLIQRGLNLAFVEAKSLHSALLDFGLVSKRKLDTDFINPFLSATIHVLKIQASIDARPGKMYLKNNDEKNFGDISGVIGIVSESFNGSVVISFPEKTFLAIMSSMLGEECTEITNDLIDGAGEITNMVFGNAKVELNQKGYGIKTAIPSVVSGKEHSLKTLSNGSIVVIPFESAIGSFFVEVVLSQ